MARLAIHWQLWRSGARCVLLDSVSGVPDTAFDGFIVSGGNDVDPALYGGDASGARTVNRARDTFELAVLDSARERSLPVLGICRGAQLLNVHAGGTLFGDIAHLRIHTSNVDTLRARKAIAADPTSRLGNLLECSQFSVNSLHHQAVDQLGSGLVVTARDRDNIVQGIEAVEEPLRVGVQWHPEYMPHHRPQRCLFSNFVRYCEERAAL